MMKIVSAVAVAGLLITASGAVSAKSTSEQKSSNWGNSGDAGTCISKESTRASNGNDLEKGEAGEVTAEHVAQLVAAGIPYGEAVRIFREACLKK